MAGATSVRKQGALRYMLHHMQGSRRAYKVSSPGETEELLSVAF